MIFSFPLPKNEQLKSDDHIIQSTVIKVLVHFGHPGSSVLHVAAGQLQNQDSLSPHETTFSHLQNILLQEETRFGTVPFYKNLLVSSIVQELGILKRRTLF